MDLLYNLVYNQPNRLLPKSPQKVEGL